MAQNTLEIEFVGEEFVSIVKMEREVYETLDHEGKTVEHTREVAQPYSQNRAFYNFRQPLSTFSDQIVPPG